MNDTAKAKALAERLYVIIASLQDQHRGAKIMAEESATEALAWFREQRPTREEIARIIARDDYIGISATHLSKADAILALWDAKERAGE